MFNKKYISKIKDLETENKDLTQKVYYSDGQIKALTDLIETLKGQLKQEYERSQQMQTTILSQVTASSDKFQENVANMYEESEEEIEEIHTKFKEEGDL